MPNLLNLIANHQKAASNPLQEFVMGVVVGYQGQSYKVNALGSTYFAENMVTDRLLTGDRVLLVLGKGSPRIIGLQGKDQDSL